ncbi:MAG: outer membrane lipoprotein carrier protein LolA [Elusimicrobia bacterium]|nr:outer membrane lipoprotein carrier protein LolA [Elusimicrobiota bacterium]
MKTVFVLLTLITVAAGNVLPGGSPQERRQDIKFILSNMAEKEKGIESIQLEFIQIMKFAATADTQTMSGGVIFKRPNRIYYRIYSPAEQIVVSDGKKLWLYNLSTNQVFVDLWKNWKGINYFIPGIFNPKGTVSDLKKYFNFELLSEEAGDYVLKLVPKEKVAADLHIMPGEFEFRMWVSTATFHPRKSMFLSENITVETDIIKYEVNVSTPDALFDFKPPADAEVLRLFK